MNMKRNLRMHKAVVVAWALMCSVVLSACNSALIERVGQRLGLGSSSSTNKVAPIPIDLPLQTQAHLRDFDAMVTALTNLYFKRDKVGKAWQALAAENREKILAGVSDEEFFALVNQTIAAVQDEDVVLLPPEVLVQPTSPLTATYSGIGVLAGLPEEGKDRLLALFVYPDSPADRAGVKAHDAIIAVDGDPVTFADRNTVIGRLRGEAGSTVVLTVRSPGQRERDVSVTRSPVRPDSPIQFQFIDGTYIAYIAPDPTNLRDMKTETANALRALQNEHSIESLILDLRVIRGTQFPINDMLGLFVNAHVANVDRRGTKDKLEITGKSIAGSQDVPMVVLVSNHTTGQAEAFAGILQSLGRARVVGEKTRGRVAVMNTLTLPSSGVRVQIPTGEYINLKNAGWYEKGIAPDALSEKTWEEVTTDDDAQLDQAVAVLQGQ